MKRVLSVTTLISLLFIQPATGNSSLDDRLRTAVSNQDFTTIEVLVKKGADPNVSNENGMTPLALAARDGKIELIKLLLDKRANINYTIVGDNTPLMLAARNNSFAAVKLLCERGADLMMKNGENKTALDIAREYKNQKSEDIITVFLISNKKTAVSGKKKGIILGSVVNLHQKPSSESSVIMQCHEGNDVTILENTGITQTLGDTTDQWVKIIIGKNVTGYVFGGYLFSFDGFYDNSWNAETCSGLIHYIIFRKNRTFKFFSGCAEPGCDEPVMKKTGSFHMEGRTIVLDQSLFDTGDVSRFYFFRYKKRNALDTTKREIDERDFMKESSGCWGWWQGGN